VACHVLVADGMENCPFCAGKQEAAPDLVNEHHTGCSTWAARFNTSPAKPPRGLRKRGLARC
jgi:hypothetical protein